MQCLALSLEKLRVLAAPQTHKPTAESSFQYAMADSWRRECTDKTKELITLGLSVKASFEILNAVRNLIFPWGSLASIGATGILDIKIPKREISWPEIIRAELFRLWSEVCGCSDGQGTWDNIIGGHPAKVFTRFVTSSQRSHRDSWHDTSTPSQWTAITMATATQFPRLEETCAFILWSGAAGWGGPISAGLWTSDSPRLLWVSFSSLVFAEVGEEITDN